MIPPTLMSAFDVNFPTRIGGTSGYVQNYIMRQVNGDPTQVYFTKGPLSESSPADPPIQIDVYMKCTICITLDPDVNWQFQTGTAATLGASGEAVRYYNLSVDDLNTQITFGADYYSNGLIGNLDPFNVFVVLDSGEKYRIDPDIRNPGAPDDLARARRQTGGR
jgi:hypothetical protein